MNLLENQCLSDLFIFACTECLYMTNSLIFACTECLNMTAKEFIVGTITREHVGDWTKKTPAWTSFSKLLQALASLYRFQQALTSNHPKPWTTFNEQIFTQTDVNWSYNGFFFFCLFFIFRSIRSLCTVISWRMKNQLFVNVYSLGGKKHYYCPHFFSSSLNRDQI